MEGFHFFTSFPTDIQRLIFEEAYEASERKAAHLALVSREVRSWIEPLMYQCMIFNCRINGGNGAERGRLFSDTFGSGCKGHQFYARFVRKVFIDRLSFNDLGERFLPLCSGLTHLACWELISHDAHKILGSVLSPDTFPKLQSLSIYCNSLPQSHQMFTHPIFKNLTHLDLDFDPNLRWGAFRSLENLTHFNLDFFNECDNNLATEIIATICKFAILAILPNTPPVLRCIVIMVTKKFLAKLVTRPYDSTDEARQIYSDIVQGKYDSRVVFGSSGGIDESLTRYLEMGKEFVHYIIPVPHDFSHWSYLPPGRKDFFMEADEIIRTRRHDQNTRSTD